MMSLSNEGKTMTPRKPFPNNFDAINHGALTQENLMQAEVQSHKEGFQEGYQAAQQEINGISAHMLEKISHQLKQLVEEQKQYHQTLEEGIIQLTLEAFEKLLPYFVAQDAFQSALQQLGTALSLLETDQTLSIALSETLHQNLTGDMKNLLAAYPHAGIIVDKKLDPTDFKITWAGGHIEHVHRRLEREIIKVLSEYEKPQEKK